MLSVGPRILLGCTVERSGARIAAIREGETMNTTVALILWVVLTFIIRVVVWHDWRDSGAAPWVKAALISGLIVLAASHYHPNPASDDAPGWP